MSTLRERLERIRDTAKDCDDIQNTAELHFLCAHIVEDAVAALATLRNPEPRSGSVNDGRLVFITREQRDWLNFNDAFGPPASEIVTAWDNAPSDPVALVDAQLRRWNRAEEDTLEESEAAYVCRALGVPSPAEQGD